MPPASLKSQKAGATSPMFTKPLPVFLLLQSTWIRFPTPETTQKSASPHFISASEVPVRASGDRAVQGAKDGRGERNISRPNPLFVGPCFGASPWYLGTHCLSPSVSQSPREDSLPGPGKQSFSPRDSDDIPGKPTSKQMLVDSPLHQAIGCFQTWPVLSSEHKLDQV